MAERSTRRLWLCGVALLVPTLYFAWRYPLLRHGTKLTDLGKLSAYTRMSFALFVGGIGLQFVAYVLALRETRLLAPGRAFKPLWWCGGIAATTMTLMYPVSAIDMFIYAVHARLFTTYGVNPSANFPRDYPSDPWVRLASRQWGQYESPYGPLWNLVAAPITTLAGDSITVALVGFKLLVLASVLVVAWTIMRSLALSSPGKAATGTLLFLWNPLILWEGIGNGHNDVVMMVPLLLAFLAFYKRRDALVIPLIVVAVSIKYVPVVILPLAAIAVWRRAETPRARLRLVAWSVGLSMLAVAIAMYPFYDVAAIRSSIAHHSAIFRLSPAAVAMTLLRGYVTGSNVKYWSQVIGRIVVILVVVWQACRVWRNTDQLATAVLLTLSVFLLVARPNVAVWYLIWPVALAALVPWTWTTWLIPSWTAAGLASYGLYIWVAGWLHLRFDRSQLVGVLLFFGVPVLLIMVRSVVLMLRVVIRRYRDSVARIRMVSGDMHGSEGRG